MDPLRRPRAPLRLLATATLVRGVTASSRLASASTVRLATLRVVERSMRPTDFCFPSLVYEHPYLVGFRPVYSRLAPRTSVRRTRWFTTPTIRFGGPCDCLISLQSPAGRFLPRDDSQDRASDTPVASLDSTPNGPLWASLPRSLRRSPRSSVHNPREETAAPTIRGVFHRKVTESSMRPGRSFPIFRTAESVFFPVSRLCHRDPVLGCSSRAASLPAPPHYAFRSQ